MSISSKQHLTPDEKLEVAYWHLLRGYPQHDLAAMYHVNQGRVSDAITSIRECVGMKRGGE